MNYENVKSSVKNEKHLNIAYKFGFIIIGILAAAFIASGLKFEYFADGYEKEAALSRQIESLNQERLDFQKMADDVEKEILDLQSQQKDLKKENAEKMYGAAPQKEEQKKK